MRAIWTGSIGFGLVNIPIKIFSAVESSSLELDMLDKNDHSRIRYKRVNENTGKEVEWDNIVRGFLMDDKYVILEKSDFDKASPEKSKHIDISQFVDLSEIDTIYFETPYYLEPDKTGDRAYKLLQEALLKSGKAGIGLFVMHSREHLCCLKANQDVIILNKIRFQEEIRSSKELKIPTEKTKPPELKMAVDLVTQLSKPFDISAFKDNYSDQLMKVIKAKSKGKSVAVPQMKVVHSKAQDLMEQLKASLSSTKSSRRKVS